MSDFKERLIAEQKDLNEKILKATQFAFGFGTQFQQMPADYQDDLIDQITHMVGYSKVLNSRINKLVN